MSSGRLLNLTPPPHPSIPNHLFAFLLRKKAADGKNFTLIQPALSTYTILKMCVHRGRRAG